jgi:hypothetical protein
VAAAWAAWGARGEDVVDVVAAVVLPAAKMEERRAPDGMAAALGKADTCGGNGSRY